MFYVYVLKSEQDGTLYIGQAENVDRRLREHNAGKTKSTKGRRPYTLEYQESYETREEAITRERTLKSGAGREFLKRICARSSTG